MAILWILQHCNTTKHAIEAPIPLSIGKPRALFSVKKGFRIFWSCNIAEYCETSLLHNCNTAKQDSLPSHCPLVNQELCSLWRGERAGVAFSQCRGYFTELQHISLDTISLETIPLETISLETISLETISLETVLEDISLLGSTLQRHLIGSNIIVYFALWKKCWLESTVEHI